MNIVVREDQSEIISEINMEYPYVCKRTDYTNTIVPWHWHEELELGYLCSGQIEVRTIDRAYTVNAGQAYFTNTNVLAQMKRLDNGDECMSDAHLFHSVFISGHFKSIFETKYLMPVLQDKNFSCLLISGENDIQKNILKKLRQLSSVCDRENEEFTVRNILSEIWVLLFDEYKRLKSKTNAVKSVNSERIQDMMLFIHEHYGDKILLEEIAGAAMISKRECLRCFQECIHQTPFEYLQNHRLNMAENLLKTTDLPITDIAMQTGFNSTAYFGKVYKTTRGMTPKEFRRSCRSDKR